MLVLGKQRLVEAALRASSVIPPHDSQSFLTGYSQYATAAFTAHWYQWVPRFSPPAQFDSQISFTIICSLGSY